MAGRARSAYPLAGKLVAGAVVAYASSPVDLIPDFIPVLGYLDDLLLVPVGIWLAVRLIPPPLFAEFRAAATSRERPRSMLGAALIVGAWLAVGALLAWWWLG